MFEIKRRVCYIIYNGKSNCSNGVIQPHRQIAPPNRFTDSSSSRAIEDKKENKNWKLRWFWMAKLFKIVITELYLNLSGANRKKKHFYKKQNEILKLQNLLEFWNYRIYWNESADRATRHPGFKLSTGCQRHPETSEFFEILGDRVSVKDPPV